VATDTLEVSDLESPITIEHRDALIYMLTEAAELEHAICCQYLYAAFSLKQSAGEGVTPRQLEAIERWRKIVLGVATEEMQHLALVNNMLLAVGGAPRVGRPNFPQRGRYYPPAVQFALLPFGEPALRHFLFLERPEGITLPDAEGFEVVGEVEPIMTSEDIAPRPQDFATVGHLYRSIEEGFKHLVERHGEDWLFIGPPRAQATPQSFHWPELTPVTDLASALVAINTVVEQGEGPRGHWRDAHYGRFLEALGEFLEMKRSDPGFEPARPVLAAFVHTPPDSEGGPLVSDANTARVLDVFNVAYEVTLHVLARFFGHVDETDAQLKCLADAAVYLMITVIKPLGEAITTLPMGPEHPGMNAGPSFEVFYRAGFLLPHGRSAWIVIHERLVELDAYLSGLIVRRQAPATLVPVQEAIRRIAGMFAEHVDELHTRRIDPPVAWLRLDPSLLDTEKS
jgi:hypothetical protein